jgi:hypothetical protein
MKRMVKIFILCLFLLVVALVLLIYIFWLPKNYVNQNIPSSFKYTQKNSVIPDEFIIKQDETKLSDGSTGYLGGESYNNQYFYQTKYKFYCKNDNKKAKIITYYSHSQGYFVIGGGSFREAFICENKYFIYDYTDYSGNKAYGPFDLN